MERFVVAAMVIAVSIATVVGAKPYTVASNSSSFTVAVGNTVLLRHSLTSPMIYVGRGQMKFNEYLGNFFINKYVQDRIELASFNISTAQASDTITFSYGTYQVTMVIQSTKGHPVVLSLRNTGAASYNSVWMRVAASPGERVYGCGEQYSYLDLRGKSFPIWVREQGVGRNKSDLATFYADKQRGGGDYYTTYFPQPTFLSSRNYYLHYSGSNFAEFDFQHPDFHEVFVYGSVHQFFFNTATTTKSLVQKLSGYLGRQPDLPDWVFTGAVLGVQGGTNVMLSRLQAARNNSVPVSGLWIQDWAGVLKTSFGSRLFWDWKWNPQLYPGLDNEIKQLKAQGVRVMAYINPNLNTKGNLFKEGSGLGFLVKTTKGQAFTLDFGEFNCGIVDLTNPEAVNWYKGKIQTNMIDLGLSGWMADFGEYLPVDGVTFYSNQSVQEIHNQWPVLWAKLNRDAIDERNKTGDIVFWMRAGFSGTGKYTTLMWAGDQNVDFSYGDGLPSTIPAALNMGMSGVGLTHFDIGGYTTFAQLGLVRSAELLLRSAEAAIFTCMFRSHEGNQPQANVQFYSTSAVQKAFGRYARMFVFLSNYTKDLVQENLNSGTPVQRPLFMEFPGDVNASSITYEYMLGSDLLVAPVIQANVSTSKVYLPSGTKWVFLWDGASYDPGFTTVPSPLGQPVAFYRDNSTYANIFSQFRSQFPPLPNPVTTVAPTPTPTTAGGCISDGSRPPCCALLIYGILVLALVVGKCQ